MLFETWEKFLQCLRAEEKCLWSQGISSVYPCVWFCLQLVIWTVICSVSTWSWKTWSAWVGHARFEAISLSGCSWSFGAWYLEQLGSSCLGWRVGWLVNKIFPCWEHGYIGLCCYLVFCGSWCRKFFKEFFFRAWPFSFPCLSNLRNYQYLGYHCISVALQEHENLERCVQLPIIFCCGSAFCNGYLFIAFGGHSAVWRVVMFPFSDYLLQLSSKSFPLAISFLLYLKLSLTAHIFFRKIFP